MSMTRRSNRRIGEAEAVLRAHERLRRRATRLNWLKLLDSRSTRQRGIEVTAEHSATGTGGPRMVVAWQRSWQICSLYVPIKVRRGICRQFPRQAYLACL